MGEAPRYNTYVPVSLESIPEGAPEMYREGFDYYQTERANEPKELYTVEGASHIDLYDVPQYVNQAVDKLTAYCKQYLNSK